MSWLGYAGESGDRIMIASAAVCRLCLTKPGASNGACSRGQSHQFGSDDYVCTVGHRAGAWVLLVTESYGKRTSVDEFRAQERRQRHKSIDITGKTAAGPFRPLLKVKNWSC